MEGTREFNLHRKSFKGGLEHSLQIPEGHSLEDGDRFFCQHQGAELRLRRGRDWPKMRKSSIITTLCKDHCMRCVHTSLYLIFPTILRVRHLMFILQMKNPRLKRVIFPRPPNKQISARVGFKPKSHTGADCFSTCDCCQAKTHAFSCLYLHQISTVDHGWLPQKDCLGGFGFERCHCQFKKL